MQNTTPSASYGAVYEELNRRWKKTCEILLGEEVGELADFEDWLSELGEPVTGAKSAVSGKPVSLSNANYPKNATFAGMDEVDFSKRFEPLGINEVKDMDSILEAVRERLYFCGDVVLGNSKFVEKSTCVLDSFYVYGSHTCESSKGVAFSTLTRFSENIFGSYLIGYSNHCIRGPSIFNCARCFEFWRCETSSDCYFAYSLHGCSDCIFCFNQWGKRNCIGNLQLPREKYTVLKKKLLDEIRERLAHDKKLPSLMEVITCSQPSLPTSVIAKANGESRQGNMRKIEEAFETTTRLVLQKQLEGLENYAPWLKKHVGDVHTGKSVISGKTVMLGDYPFISHIPKNRLVSESETGIVEKLALDPAETEKLRFGTAGELVGRIAFFPAEWYFGTNDNIIECDQAAYACNCYRTSVARDIKYAAYSWWPKDCEYIFGSRILFDSSFCINCYSSTKLRSCFEMDNSRHCSDAYFCHNAENLQDSMFCFNAKNLRYAIGNASLPIDRYKTVKATLLNQITDELEKNKDLKWDIYNIATRH